MRRVDRGSMAPGFGGTLRFSSSRDMSVNVVEMFFDGAHLAWVVMHVEHSLDLLY